ncbi:MAG: MFS transporter [Acidobacteriota bacterium]
MGDPRGEPEGFRWGRVVSWSLYDFANSPYSTIMTTIGFPLFFMAVVMPGRTGPFQWGLLYGLSEVAAAALSPGLGAWSDQAGRRKPFLITFSLLCIAGTALCALLGPGDLVKAWLFFGLANVGFACANVFYNALLVEVAPAGKTDTVSGIGWGTGYLGGLLGMLLVIPFYRDGASLGNMANIHASFLLVAGAFLFFALPIFFMRERGARPSGRIGGLGQAYRQVWATLKAIRRFRNLFWFLLANFFFNDGLNTVIIFAGAYAKQVLRVRDKDIFLLFLYLNVVAAAGAYALGWLADRFGSRRTLLVLVALWALLCGGLATVQTYTQFIVGAGFAGLMLGATQSIARGFLARLAPKEKEGEFFGFFGMAGKVAALIGPVLFGGVTSLTGSMRLGALSMAPLFFLGGFFLWKVREDGSQAGQAP